MFNRNDLKTDRSYEKKMLVKVKRGVKKAFEPIVKIYMKKAYYCALSFVGNEEDALELSQEGFVRAFRSIKRYDLKKNFFPWLYQIIKNLCLDFLNKRKKDLIMSEKLKAIDLEKTREKRIDKESVWQAIETLKPEQREIIVLKYFQNYSYREIADIMDKPLGSIMSSLYYSKQKLKKEMGQLLK